MISIVTKPTTQKKPKLSKDCWKNHFHFRSQCTPFFCRRNERSERKVEYHDVSCGDVEYHVSHESIMGRVTLKHTTSDNQRNIPNKMVNALPASGGSN